MKKIAITGPSGSGKGYISSLLQKKGYPTLDTDVVVHDLYDDLSFVSSLEDALNVKITNENGLDRKILSEIVFHSKEKMAILQMHVYPMVRKKIDDFFKTSKACGASLSFVDAPQLFEAGFEKDFDLILCVSSPMDIRLSRVMKRDSITKEKALLRFSNQCSSEEYERKSNFVLMNDGQKNIVDSLDKILEKLEQPL